MKPADKLRILELTLKSLEEDISSAEFIELDQYLAASDENQRYYRGVVDMYVELYEGYEAITASMNSIDPVLQEQLWESLAEYEKNAPPQVIEDITAPQVIRKVDKSALKYPHRKIERTALYTIIGAVAALVCLIIYINFIPARKVAEPVAALTDSLNAHWANAEPMETGTVISSTRGPMILTKGVAEFLCEDRTRVLLEAPAEFEFLNVNRVALNYGRLYAVSSTGSVGFTVDTPGSRIVDLGTEFGVKVEVTGATEIHMIKGKASLVMGNPKDARNDVILTEKQARRIDADKGIFKVLAYHENDFVREIDSTKKIIWRGESVNLADIVGGGDGFGAGQVGLAIDPRTADSFRVADVTDWGPFEGPQQYTPVKSNDFIDGVFVPDGENGPVTVSTTGLQFLNCPNTANMFWAGVANGGRYPEPLNAPAKALSFNHQTYGTAEKPAIFMHTNLGVTFDLEAIRKANPDLNITEFRSVCGICENGPNRFPYADFWVLVDGKLRFSQTGVTAGKVHEILLPITKRDRFLTLATTDGGQEVCLRLENDIPIPIDSDWCLFADPYLIVEGK